jgi:streptogramin lyase
MRRAAVIGATCLVLGGCGGSTSTTTSTATERSAPAPPAPAGRVVSIPVNGNPAGIVAGLGSSWTIGHRNGFIYRIDPRTAKVIRTIGLGGTYYVGLAVGDGHVWTYRDDEHRLLKIDPTRGRVVASAGMPVQLHQSVFAPSGLWALAGGNSLVRIDPGTLRIVKRVRLPI